MAELADIQTKAAKDDTRAESGQPARQDAHIVILKAGDSFYGIDIKLVQEIVLMQEITKVSGSASHIAGMTDLRGQVIPVAEFATLLDYTPSERNEDTRILVVEHNASHIGLIVDAVTEVMLVDAAQIEDGACTGAQDNNYIVGVARMEDHLVSLVDIEQLLDGANRLEEAAAQAA